MSVTMTKGEGVTVFTMTSNSKSVWPPLCQIFGALCYSPVCCSLSRGPKVMTRNLSSLASIQIMVGLLTLGLGGIRFTSNTSWEMRWNATPFWVGGVVIALGIVCILVDKFPNRCLFGITVLMSLMGVGVAITGIVFYAIDMANIQDSLDWLCRKEYRYYRRWRDEMTTPMPVVDVVQESFYQKCREGKEMLALLLGGLDIMLIILGALELCVTLSNAILRIKALCHFKSEKSQGIEEPLPYKSLVDEANTTAPA